MKTPEEIEKLADEKYLEKVEDINNSTIRGFIVSAVKGGFVEGYQQCQEDNKDKKYTEEDMINAFNSGYDIRSSYGDRDDNMTAEQYINSLNKQD